MKKIASSPRKSKRNPKGSKTSKPIYRVRNWSTYEKSLKQRGSLTIWFSEAVTRKWKYEGPRQRGGQFEYSDVAIETALTLRSLYGLGLRQTEGFVESVLNLMGLDLEAPDHTTLSRRQVTVAVDLPKRQSKQSVHLVVDSTGLKVYGEGEWKVRQHRWSKRRTWRKLHIGVDEATGEILASTLTPNAIHDADQVGPVLEQVKGPITALGGDGSYDKWQVYDTLSNPPGRPEAITPLIPPQRNAKITQHGNCKKPPLPRDEAIRTIRKIGRKAWKAQGEYHRRSIAETAFSRYKRIFGPHLQAREFSRQKQESKLKCSILNRMVGLGKPDSYKVVIAA